MSLPRPDQSLDARHLLCPLPVLKARKRLMTMQPGEVLEVFATDPAAIIDMPHFCAEAGHDFLGAEETENATRYLLRRGTR